MYPQIAIEVQDALGAHGYGFDLLLGCSAATGATQLAAQAVQLGQAQCALVVVPELTTGHMNWRERDSHFIFGDASVALVVEPAERARPGAWEILSTRMMSKWSNNIRNNGGYLSRCDPRTEHDIDKLFHQNGRSVFKDVVPLAAKFISEHLAAHDLRPDQIGRYWLHQANQKLNELVVLDDSDPRFSRVRVDQNFSFHRCPTRGRLPATRQEGCGGNPGDVVRAVSGKRQRQHAKGMSEASG